MKNRKRSISILLLLSLLISVLPVYGADLPKEKYSPWAIGELIHAERIGIFDNSWYSDNFTGNIKEYQVDYILKSIDNKIQETELEVNKEFKSILINSKTSREGYLKSLFNTLGKYDKDIKSEIDPIEYLISKKILMGTKKSLELDREVTTEEAVIFAKRAVFHLYEKYDLGSEGLMWKVKKDGKEVYLLGSIHMADSSIYPMSSDIMKVFNDADELHVEVNLVDPEVSKSAIERMYYKDGTSLKSVVGDELYRDTIQVLNRYGVDESVVKNMKPWAVVFQLSSLSIVSDNPQEAAEHGIDMYFLLNAMMKEKKIVEIEGMDSQLRIFDELDTKAQTELLRESVVGLLDLKEENQDVPKEILDLMLETWKDGDLESFKDIISIGNEESEMDKLLLGDRDEAMAKKIINILEDKSIKDGKYFIVVGAAHYVTDGAVVDILKDKGYEVEFLGGKN